MSNHKPVLSRLAIPLAIAALALGTAAQASPRPSLSVDIVGELGAWIAAQGNAALRELREEWRREWREHLKPVPLPAPPRPNPRLPDQS